MWSDNKEDTTNLVKSILLEPWGKKQMGINQQRVGEEEAECVCQGGEAGWAGEETTLSNS